MNPDFIQQAPMQFTDVADAGAAPAAPASGGDKTNLLRSIGRGLAAVPQYFYRTDIENPTRELAAQATGNKTAYNNVEKSIYNTMGSNASQALKRLAGNSAQLAALGIAPAGDASLAGKAIVGARAGAVAGAGNALANNQSILKGAAVGAGAGGVGAAVLPTATSAILKGLGLGGKVSAAAGDETANASSGKVSGIMNKLANKQAAKQATTQALQDEAPYQAVPRNVREDTNMQGVVTKLRSNNIAPTPQNMTIYHDTMTGAQGAGNGTVHQILGNVGPVDISSVMNDVRGAVANLKGTLGDVSVKNGAASNLLDEIRNTIDTKLNPQGVGILGQKDASGKLIGGTVKINTSKADPNAVLDAIQDLERNKIYNQPNTDLGSARASVAKVAKASLNKALTSKGGAGADSAVAGYKLSLEDENGIRNAVTQQGGPPEMGDMIIKDINGANSVQGLRSAQEPAVQAGELSKAANRAAGGTLTKAPPAGEKTSTANMLFRTQQLMHAAKNPEEAIPLIAGKAGNILENMAGKAALARGAGTASAVNPIAQGAGEALDQGEVAQAGGSNNTISNIFNKLSGVGSAIGNASGRGAVAAPAAQSVLANASASPGAASLANTSLASATLPALSAGSTDLPSSGISQSQQPNQSEYTQQDMLEDIERDPANMSSYESLFKMLNPNYDLTTDQQNEVTGAQKAQTALSDYYNQLTAAGGGKGKIGGDIENIMGEFGITGTAQAARAISTQRTDVAASVAGALSPTGRPAASMTKQIADSLPTITDTKAVAEDKMQQLMQRIQDGEFSASQPLDSTIGM